VGACGSPPGWPTSWERSRSSRFSFWGGRAGRSAASTCGSSSGNGGRRVATRSSRDMPTSSSWDSKYHADGVRLQEELRRRLQGFGLELHPEKTRLIEFAHFAVRRREERGLGKPATFNFLGFTHICARAREGKFLLVRRTMRERLRCVSSARWDLRGGRRATGVPYRDRKIGAASAARSRKIIDADLRGPRAWASKSSLARACPSPVTPAQSWPVASASRVNSIRCQGVASSAPCRRT
jgi:hypothetical protein